MENIEVEKLVVFFVRVVKYKVIFIYFVVVFLSVVETHSKTTKIKWFVKLDEYSNL